MHPMFSFRLSAVKQSGACVGSRRWLLTQGIPAAPLSCCISRESRRYVLSPTIRGDKNRRSGLFTEFGSGKRSAQLQRLPHSRGDPGKSAHSSDRSRPVATFATRSAAPSADHPTPVTTVSPFRFCNQSIPALAHRRMRTRGNVQPLAAYCCINCSTRSRMAWPRHPAFAPQASRLFNHSSCACFTAPASSPASPSARR